MFINSHNIVIDFLRCDTSETQTTIPHNWSFCKILRGLTIH